MIFAGLFVSCNQAQQKSDKNYEANINEWHKQRIKSLKEEDSWLSLSGLFPLDKGTQTLGADSTNDIVFPPEAPSQIGTITRQGDKFKIDVQPEVNITHDGAQISEMELTTSAGGTPTELRYNNLLWYIIERRGDYYIRLKDTNHPNLTSFDGIDRFPVSTEWRVKASFNRFNQPQVITIPDVLGKQYQDSLYGILEFTINGNQYTLAPTGHPDKDDEFFIIFGDLTNGESTYSGGRYIYIPTPDGDGTTHVDFNKAYNPPCVFTDYATCPLPPPQNHLELEVKAGEKMYSK